jgi:hypothetical protein
MNSSQRRQHKRKVEHEITLDIKDERYFEFDLRVDKAKKFCKRKCKGFWMYEKSWNSARFCFQKHSDATYFGLMFL